MRTRMSAVVVALSVLAVVIGAQSGRGQLAGTVTDASGAPLPGVTITLSGAERRTALTNARGEFTFVNLLPGAYEIRAELAGFTTRLAKATVVDGRTARVSLELKVGALEETVTVTGETPSAKVTDSMAAASPRIGGVTGGVAGGLLTNLGFASAVAEFGMLLTRSEYRGRASYESAVARARMFRGSDPEGYRAEFVSLVDLAAGLRDLRGRAE